MTDPFAPPSPQEPRGSRETAEQPTENVDYEKPTTPLPYPSGSAPETPSVYPAAPAPAGTPPGGTPYGTAPYGAASYQATPAGPTDSRGWVIAAFLLFWPLGIAALFPSLRASRAIGAGDLRTAAAEATTAKKRGIIAIIVFAVLSVLYVLLWVGVFAAAMFSQSGDLEDAFSDPDPFASEESADDTFTEEAPVVTGEEVSLDQLALGDCLTGVSLWFEVPETVGRVPCDEPHSGEVYSSFPASSAEYESVDAMETAVDERCYAEFNTFVGMDYYDSELDYWVAPGATSGDVTTFGCIVGSYSGDTITGTLQGANY